MTTLKNKKGVSLVELIAVIVIMGIIATVGGISVAQIISNSNKSAAQTAVSDIYAAAKNKCQSENLASGATFTVDKLVDEGYLEKATADKLKSGAANITVTYQSNEVQLSEASGSPNTDILVGDFKVTLTNGAWVAKPAS